MNHAPVSGSSATYVWIPIGAALFLVALKWRYKQDIFGAAEAVRLSTRPIFAIRETVPLTKADFFAIAGPRAFKTAIFPNQRFHTWL